MVTLAKGEIMSTVKMNCLNCHRLFDALLREVRRGNAKFCSRSCSSQYTHKQKQRPENNCKCALCGKEFYKNKTELKNSRSGLYFCCRAHKDKAQRLGGIREIMPSHYGTGIKGDPHIYRKIAFENHLKQCNHCGFNKHPEILQVHHKDCNSRNNNPNNLEMLCPNCHTWEHYKTCSGLYHTITVMDD